jgi:hypothetical protein
VTEFKVTVGIKEQKLKADSESAATAQALDALRDNVAWVQATRVEPLRTGFKHETDQGGADQVDD